MDQGNNRKLEALLLAEGQDNNNDVKPNRVLVQILLELVKARLRHSLEARKAENEADAPWNLG